MSIRWSKKVRSVPKRLPLHGAVRIRPVSLHMDSYVDRYVVSGGGFKPVVIGGKREALGAARARVRVIRKHNLRRKQRKR